MIRVARFGDIPRLCELVIEAHGKSKYRDIKLNINLFKDLCKNCIVSGNGCLFVCETKGTVEGYLIGAVDVLYQILTVKYATDLQFYVSENAGRGAFGLMNSFLGWARDQKVYSVRIGAVDMIENYDRFSALLKRKGFAQEGILFEKRMMQ